MPNGDQVKHGKAFEYAIALEYRNYLTEERHIPAEFVIDDAFNTARDFFFDHPLNEQELYRLSARASINTMMKLEAGFTSPRNAEDILRIKIAADREGEEGDVRDVIFSRAAWEVGFSAKNNNDAVKHSRLSHILDFGWEWLGYHVSDSYWEAIRPVFDTLAVYKDLDMDWSDVENKWERIYIPLLDAFKEELMRIYRAHSDVPEKLISYLLGRFAFYKMIKDDDSSMVIVKAFNLNNGLNKTVNGNRPAYKTKKVNFPTRIVEFDYKIDRDGSRSQTTLNMILDEGWEISFRLHSAKTKVEKSLKFDVQLLGNPPILFTQYIFSED